MSESLKLLGDGRLELREVIAVARDPSRVVVAARSGEGPERLVRTARYIEQAVASGQRQIEFDTDRPPQHHRLEIVAVNTIDAATSCPVTGFLHLDLQTTYLSYTRQANLKKEWGYHIAK